MSNTQTLPLPVVSIDAVNAVPVPQTAAWAFTAPSVDQVGTVMSGGTTDGKGPLQNATTEVVQPSVQVVSIDAQNSSSSPQTAAWAFTVGVSNIAVNLGANCLGDCLGNAITDQRPVGGIS